MQREDVERLAELLAKATADEWRYSEVVGGCFVYAGNRQVLSYRYSPNAENRANAALIAEAVNALPELLRVYRAWLESPVGKVVHVHMDTERPTWHVMDNREAVSLEIGGQSVRLVREGGEGG